MAAVHNGVIPIWSSEIEKFPMAVTKHHFPDVIQLGDITKLDGATLPPVDIICAGSPCQDLSVAGKREGLKGERSGLFRTAVSIVRRMRMCTGGRQPRFFVWENVPGAFSSNKGLDFRAVLAEIGQADIPVPEGGKWANAGLAELPECDIAWRVIDSKYWGVPHRRRRIFLVADFGAGNRCAAKVLFERDSVPADPAECRKEKDPDAGAVKGCAGRTGIMCLNKGYPQAHRIYSPEGVAPTLSAREGHGGEPGIVFCIQGNVADRDVTMNGTGISENVAATLNATDRHAVCIGNGQINQQISETVGALNCMHDQQAVWIPDTAHTLRGRHNLALRDDMDTLVCRKTVRRMTPLECERLQGLPDGWTLIDDPSCSDSARYRALGNGMAQPCADFVIRRIVEEVERETKCELD